MNHNRICTSFRKSKCSSQGIIHALLKNQALNTSANHKLFGLLSTLTCTNLFTEVRNSCLCLLYLCTKETIFFQACLILNNHHTNSHTLQRTDRINKVLCQTTSIAIKNNRFSGHFHDIINSTKTAGHIHQFNIRLTLCSRVTKRTDPHRIKLIGFAILKDLSILYNKTRYTAMSLQSCDQTFHVDKFAEPTSSYIRHRCL